MRKPVSFLLALLMICVLFRFLPGALLKYTDPYRIDEGPGILEQESEGRITGYEEAFAVRRGAITDTVTFDETIPPGSYETKSLYLSSDEGRLTAGPGDFIAPGRVVWHYKNGSVLRFPSSSRILSVLEEPPAEDLSGTRIHVRYMTSPNILLKLKLPEHSLNKVHSQTRIQAWIGNVPAQAELVSTGDTVTEGSFSVVLSLKDPELLGRNGSSVKVQIILEEKPDVLLVPCECVFHNNAGEPYVLLQTGEDAVETSVETGITDGRMTEITSGLSEGDLVLAI